MAPIDCIPQFALFRMLSVSIMKFWVGIWALIKEWDNVLAERD